jgi:transcriptional regulator with XRE-family HTH domain/predicted transcriptional regulator
MSSTKRGGAVDLLCEREPHPGHEDGVVANLIQVLGFILMDHEWHTEPDLRERVEEVLGPVNPVTFYMVLKSMRKHGCVVKVTRGRNARTRRYVVWGRGMPHYGSSAPRLPDPPPLVPYAPRPDRNPDWATRKPDPATARRVRADIVAALLATDGYTGAQVEHKVQGKASTIREVLARLVEEGRVEKHQSAHGPYYTHPDRTESKGPTCMTDKRVNITELDDTIASRLKRVRGALGLKSAEMADHLGIGASKYSGLETGKGPCDDALLEQFDNALAVNGVPAGWLKGEAVTLLATDTVNQIEIWEFSSEALLGEIGRRLAAPEEADPIAPAVVFAQAHPDESMPLAAPIVLTPPLPSIPVAPPAVDVPLPLELAPIAPVVTFVSAPTPIDNEVSAITALIGSAPALTPPPTFEQPAVIPEVPVAAIDVLLAQMGNFTLPVPAPAL